jgi:hypothetical protein
VVDHGERLSRIRSVGLALGFAGVGALVGFDVRGGDLLSVAEVAVVVVCYATAPLIASRYLSDVPATGITAVALAVTAAVYLPSALPAGGAERAGGRRRARAHRCLHRRRAARLLRAHRRGRTAARARHHLRQPGRRAGARASGCCPSR